MKKQIENFDEENSIVIDDRYTVDTFDFYPDEKRFKISSSIKDDCFYNNSIIEYKISCDPIELKMRTVELFHEPPKEYSIRDGVVLESEINKEEINSSDRIKDLKKQVAWSNVEIFRNCQINLNILSRHPEIISKDQYRKFLRKSAERMKVGVAKVKEKIEKDIHELELRTFEHGVGIWYKGDESLIKEREDYCNLDEEERDHSPYGEKIKYVEDFNNSLFNKKSSSYVGISKDEFENSSEVIECIQELLDKKDRPIKKEIEPKSSRVKGYMKSSLLTLLLSWIVSLFVGINPFLIFIIVQIIAFAQAVIGSYLVD